LRVTAIDAPATIVADDTVTLSWTVQNQGAVTAFPDWTDYVFLSTDAVLNPQDPFVTAVSSGDQSPLAGGASYTLSTTVTLPNLGVGPRFLIVVTDRDGSLGETDETNNILARP